MSFQLAGKTFLTSRTDFTVILLFEFLKKHQLHIAHWASEKQNSLAQQQNPLAPGYCTLLSLHAGGPYLIEHFFSLKDKKRTGECMRVTEMELTGDSACLVPVLCPRFSAQR